jgi:hypothetical protein
MTSMQMYWLLKLDDIRSFLEEGGAFITALSVFAVLAWGFIPMFNALEDCDDTRIAKCKKTAGKCVVLVFVWLMLYCTVYMLMPTTKQAAMIYCVPKIVNSEWANETLPNEAKELYGLAKSWLREKAGDAGDAVKCDK